MYSTLNHLCILGTRNLLHESRALLPVLQESGCLQRHISCSTFKGFPLTQHVSIPHNVPTKTCIIGLLSISQACQFPNLVPIRNTSFFTRVTADQLWKGVTSVSNAGRKRGRGKGSRKIRVRDLNKGIPLGSGKKNIVWPGLNKPVLSGQRVTERHELPSDPERMEKIYQMRDRMGTFRILKMNPLERGWSGIKLGGKKIGPPEPIAGESFEQFESIVLESKVVTNMDGNLGRKRRHSMFVVTGNGNGSGGFGLSKSMVIRDTMRKAKNRAIKGLVYIERCEEHTVYHDFFSQYHKVKLYVKRKPPGYGLVCHRVLKAICQVIGIKDIHIKIEGAKNTQNMTKAFFLGLMQQKTHEQLAEEKSLHVVKMLPGDFPQVVASPKSKDVRTSEQIELDEELDYKMYTMGGRIEKERQKFQPFYERLPSYERFLIKEVKRRNHSKIEHDLRYHYGGELKSFYTENHPECKEFILLPKEKEDEEEEEY